MIQAPGLSGKTVWKGWLNTIDLLYNIRKDLFPEKIKFITEDYFVQHMNITIK
jgi:hypothetical protein